MGRVRGRATHPCGQHDGISHKFPFDKSKWGEEEQRERELFRYHVADVRDNEAFDGPFIALDGSFSCHFCFCLLLAGCCGGVM